MGRSKVSDIPRNGELQPRIYLEAGIIPQLITSLSDIRLRVANITNPEIVIDGGLMIIDSVLEQYIAEMHEELSQRRPITYGDVEHLAR